MKRIVILGTVTLTLLGMGCQKTDKQLSDTIAKLEQRIETLEKKLTAPPSPGREQAEQTAAYNFPSGKFVLGNPGAPITVTKFSDYQCPFCSRAHESFVEELFKDPELKDKVKVEFRQFPLSFHTNAKPAAKAALAAGRQGNQCFWEMTKKLYSGQKELSETKYKAWASEIKCQKENGKVEPLNVDTFLSDLKKHDNDFEEMIKTDMKLGMETANVRGTPSFFVNGWRLNGRTVDAVKQVIKDKNLMPGTGTAPGHG